jgi:site-specific DNA-methyltransferase (adenine-specific)
VKPYYEQDGIVIYHGDCREVLPLLGAVDVVIADPPYGVTSLAWDERVDGWLDLVPSDNLWCFGSMRFFMAQQFAGWTYAQEIVWEKHNGSIFHADRFRRVHEFAVQFYRGQWGAIYHAPVYTLDATKRTAQRKGRPPHAGEIGSANYVSQDGGPRLMRSVLQVRSCHGSAEHPTQKPIGILRPLIEYSCPADGGVLDPFMGSGTTLRAAKDLGRKAIGIEIEERYAEIAARRMMQEVLPLGYDEKGNRLKGSGVAAMAGTQPPLCDASVPDVPDDLSPSRPTKEVR